MQSQGLSQRERTLLTALAAAARFMGEGQLADAKAALKLAERSYRQITKERQTWTKLNLSTTS